MILLAGKQFYYTAMTKEIQYFMMKFKSSAHDPDNCFSIIPHHEPPPSVSTKEIYNKTCHIGVTFGFTKNRGGVGFSKKQPNKKLIEREQATSQRCLFPFLLSKRFSCSEKCVFCDICDFLAYFGGKRAVHPCVCLRVLRDLRVRRYRPQFC